MIFLHSDKFTHVNVCQHHAHSPLCLPQASSSTWPCTASVSAGDSGPSGLWTQRTFTIRTSPKEASQPPNSPIWVSTPARTRSRTTRTRRETARLGTCRRPTATPLATRCMTLTWTRSALKSTSSSVDTHVHTAHATCRHTTGGRCNPPAHNMPPTSSNWGVFLCQQRPPGFKLHSVVEEL